ncbi:hypothetical protein L1887_31666 [Cichorium endivia]|nr:hypothetical protein L1887_31666 [Cichorium endivia]
MSSGSRVNPPFSQIRLHEVDFKDDCSNIDVRHITSYLLHNICLLSFGSLQFAARCPGQSQLWQLLTTPSNIKGFSANWEKLRRKTDEKKKLGHISVANFKDFGLGKTCASQKELCRDAGTLISHNYKYRSPVRLLKHPGTRRRDPKAEFRQFLVGIDSLVSYLLLLLFYQLGIERTHDLDIPISSELRGLLGQESHKIQGSEIEEHLLLSPLKVQTTNDQSMHFIDWSEFLYL